MHLFTLHCKHDEDLANPFPEGYAYNCQYMHSGSYPPSTVLLLALNANEQSTWVFRLAEMKMSWNDGDSRIKNRDVDCNDDGNGDSLYE